MQGSHERHAHTHTHTHTHAHTHAHTHTHTHTTHNTYTHTYTHTTHTHTHSYMHTCMNVRMYVSNINVCKKFSQSLCTTCERSGSASIVVTFVFTLPQDVCKAFFAHAIQFAMRDGNIVSVNIVLLIVSIYAIIQRRPRVVTNTSMLHVTRNSREL